jgi:hypothetical protein
MTEVPLSNLCQQNEHPNCISFSDISQIEFVKLASTTDIMLNAGLVW